MRLGGALWIGGKGILVYHTVATWLAIA